jgi:hypothetical protein
MPPERVKEAQEPIGPEDRRTRKSSDLMRMRSRPASRSHDAREILLD